MNHNITLQDVASNPNNPFIWISASAGTGKTKILVDRILKLLIDDRNNILCLTFTNAAVYEIKERICKILETWAITKEDQLKLEARSLLNIDITINQARKIRKLFSNFSRLDIKIQTIHSFCHQLISSFPKEAGISYDFKVLDFKEYYFQLEKLLLTNKIIQENFDYLLQNITESHISVLLYNTILHIKNSYFSTQDYKKYILDKLKCVNNYNFNFSVNHLKQLLIIIQKGSVRDKKIGLKIQNWINFDDESKKNHLSEYAKIFINIETLTIKPITSIITQKTLATFPDIKDILIKEQNEILQILQILHANNIATHSIALIEIAEKFIELYNTEKYTKGFIDYDDIIYLALKLLTNPDHKDWILFNLDHTINHILVDESQDNSLKQWNIIANLCDEFFSGSGTTVEQRTLFIVGDVKQSIYSFQNARPDYFEPMKQYFMKYCQDSKILNLTKSFRSVGSILKLVDKIFNKFRHEISFTNEEIIHTSHRTRDSGTVEVWPLVDSVKHNKTDAWSINNISCHVKNAKELLACKIANEIYTWINTNKILIGKNRKITYADIMILVRHRDAFIDHLISQFKNLNIPVTERDRFSILDHIAVKDLVNLGECLLLPENNIILANLLKSPIFNLTDKELFMLSYERENECLWIMLENTFTDIASYIRKLIKIAKLNSITYLYTYILNDNQDKFMSRLGKECKYYIEEFFNIIIEYEYNNISSLENFLHWIKNNNPKIKNNIICNNKEVRIMTIHNAKGLQSPIIFLADTTALPKDDHSIIFDSNEVPFCPLQFSNIYVHHLKQDKKKAAYSEYLRLLYVAMTRAEDALYIVGESPAHEKSWYSIIEKEVTSPTAQ